MIFLEGLFRVKDLIFISAGMSIQGSLEGFWA